MFNNKEKEIENKNGNRTDKLIKLEQVYWSNDLIEFEFLPFLSFHCLFSPPDLVSSPPPIVDVCYQPLGYICLHNHWTTIVPVVLLLSLPTVWAAQKKASLFEMSWWISPLKSSWRLTSLYSKRKTWRNKTKKKTWRCTTVIEEAVSGSVPPLLLSRRVQLALVHAMIKLFSSLLLPCRVSPWCARRHPPLQGSCPSGDRHGIVTRCGVVKPCPVLWLARSCNKTNTKN